MHNIVHVDPLKLDSCEIQSNLKEILGGANDILCNVRLMADWDTGEVIELALSSVFVSSRFHILLRNISKKFGNDFPINGPVVHSD